jgi:hypothetical protein
MMDLYWTLKCTENFNIRSFVFLLVSESWYSSTIADVSLFCASFMLVSDGTTNNLNEYIMMSVGDVADRERMANDVYCNKHGVVLNETIFPEFFAQLPAPHT